VIAGVWLLFAPLVFWTPSGAVYTHDALIGALVLAFGMVGALGIVVAPLGAVSIWFITSSRSLSTRTTRCVGDACYGWSQAAVID